MRESEMSRHPLEDEISAAVEKVDRTMKVLRALINDEATAPDERLEAIQAMMRLQRVLIEGAPDLIDFLLTLALDRDADGAARETARQAILSYGWATEEDLDRGLKDELREHIKQLAIDQGRWPESDR
jgi:hypothetical protein